MPKENDLLLFLKEQLEHVKNRIKGRNYSSDLDEQVVLWDLYELILNNIREEEK